MYTETRGYVLAILAGEKPRLVAPNKTDRGRVRVGELGKPLQPRPAPNEDVASRKQGTVTSPYLVTLPCLPSRCVRIKMCNPDFLGTGLVVTLELPIQ
ncbi:hypothetical protein VUR80DRAFT_9220 [Thermomyces stellatus]